MKKLMGLKLDLMEMEMERVAGGAMGTGPIGYPLLKTGPIGTGPLGTGPLNETGPIGYPYAQKTGPLGTGPLKETGPIGYPY